MITVWAGKFTPQARVDVETKTWIWRSANKSSTKVRSTLFNPAWWTPNPKGSKSLSSGDDLILAVSDYKIVYETEFSLRNLIEINTFQVHPLNKPYPLKLKQLWLSHDENEQKL